MPKIKSRTNPSKVEKSGTVENHIGLPNLDWKSRCLSAQLSPDGLEHSKPEFAVVRYRQ
jgi:hypothetical protein